MSLACKRYKVIKKTDDTIFVVTIKTKGVIC